MWSLTVRVVFIKKGMKEGVQVLLPEETVQFSAVSHWSGVPPIHKHPVKSPSSSTQKLCGNVGWKTGHLVLLLLLSLAHLL